MGPNHRRSSASSRSEQPAAVGAASGRRARRQAASAITGRAGSLHRAALGLPAPFLPLGQGADMVGRRRRGLGIGPDRRAVACGPLRTRFAPLPIARLGRVLGDRAAGEEQRQNGGQGRKPALPRARRRDRDPRHVSTRSGREPACARATRRHSACRRSRRSSRRGFARDAASAWNRGGAGTQPRRSADSPL